MINVHWVLISPLFSALGSGRYIINTIRGNIAPNRITWSFWALASTITFVAEIHQGVGLRALVVFTSALFPLLIFLASFHNRNAYWKLGPFDYGCGLLAVAAMAGWLVTSNANIAIIFSVLADLLATIPTFVKCIKKSSSESPSAFMAGMSSGVITLLTIKNWDFATSTFPIYLVASTWILIVTLAIGKHRDKALGNEALPTN